MRIDFFIAYQNSIPKKYEYSSFYVKQDFMKYIIRFKIVPHEAELNDDEEQLNKIILLFFKYVMNLTFYLHNRQYWISVALNKIPLCFFLI